jgi:MFS transporter, MHS family, proline/betaine transporter
VTATIVGTITAGVLIPVVGHVVDRSGRRILLRVAQTLAIILAWPVFRFISAAPSLASLLVYQIVFGMVIALYRRRSSPASVRCSPTARRRSD